MRFFFIYIKTFKCSFSHFSVYTYFYVGIAFVRISNKALIIPRTIKFKIPGLALLCSSGLRGSQFPRGRVICFYCGQSEIPKVKLAVAIRVFMYSTEYLTEFGGWSPTLNVCIYPYLYENSSESRKQNAFS